MKLNNENSYDTSVASSATLFSIAEDELLIVENQGQSRLRYGTTSGTLDGVLAPGEEEVFSTSQYLKATGGRQRCGVRVTTGRPSLPRTVASTSVALYQDFSDAADGAPTVADTGQTWTLFNSRDAGSEPVIADGFLTNDLAALSDPGNGYCQTELAGNATRIGCRWAYTTAPSSTTAKIVLLILADVYDNGAELPSMACHLICDDNKFSFSVWNGFQHDETGIVDLFNGYFDENLATDGTLYELEATIDYETGTVVVSSSVPFTSPPGELSNADAAFSPDGRLVSFTDARIITFAGPWVCFETLGSLLDPDTSGVVGFEEVWADASA